MAFKPLDGHFKIITNARIAEKVEGTWRDASTGQVKPTRTLKVVFEGGSVAFRYRDDPDSLAAWAKAPSEGRFDVLAEVESVKGAEYPKTPRFFPVGVCGVNVPDRAAA